MDTLEAADVRPSNVRAELEAQGAAKEDLDAMEQAVQPAEGQPSPVVRFVLVRQGTTELNELLPGPLLGPEKISVDPIPDLLALLKHRPEVFPYVVAEVSGDHGEIRLHYAGNNGPESIEEVQGETEHLSKFPGGGWSHRRFQQHTEEVWRRNADQVAAEIDRVVGSSGARLVVLAGDIRARGLVQDQLSTATQNASRPRKARPTPSRPPALELSSMRSSRHRWTC